MLSWLRVGHLAPGGALGSRWPGPSRENGQRAGGHAPAPMLWLTISGGSVARSYFTVLQALPDLALQPIASGHYHDRFERRGGQWRFAARRATVVLVGDVSRHLRQAQ